MRLGTRRRPRDAEATDRPHAIQLEEAAIRRIDRGGQASPERMAVLASATFPSFAVDRAVDLEARADPESLDTLRSGLGGYRRERGAR